MTLQAFFLARDALAQLFNQLDAHYDRIIGPTVKDGAVVYAELQSPQQLPAGFRDTTAAGHYRLEKEDSPRCFDWVSTPQGLKPWVFLPEESLWVLKPQGDGDQAGFSSCEVPVERLAVLGVRACDLAALKLLDQHFLQGDYNDPRYRQRRAGLLIIAVNCHRSLETCFCVSTGDGPEVTRGHDLVLDELDEGFVVAAGSSQGEDLLNKLDLAPATAQQLEAAIARRQPATRQQRALPARDLRTALYAAEADVTRWEEVAGRCLTCGNCTAVCPTCFCFRTGDEATLDGSQITHRRQWDSCFSDAHSHLAGTQIRNQPAHKYRQWLLHKLAYWHQQYGRSGCTGCGRCIAWCPAAIDLVAEARRLCQEEGLADD
jgi:ferredoxin